MSRPQVNGWENINLNKPQEYSSEFSANGIRYANVTNVTTGQRQLYVVSGIPGTPFTQRTLVTSINANGSVTQGEGYDDFIRVYGRDKLQNAERINKSQSIFIVRRASTPSEIDFLSTTREYRSLANQARSGTSNNNEPGGNSSLRVITLDTRNISLGSPIPPGSVGVYPLDIGNTKQDRIKFQAVTIQDRTLKQAIEYIPANAGPIYISIQGPIVDQNAAGWGESELGFGSLAAGEIAGAEMADGGGASKAGELITQALGEIGSDENTKNSVLAAAAAGDMSLFTRATSQVFNPNLELLFQKPQLRSFNFSFKMSARDEEEAAMIKKIIRYFKFHSAVKDMEGFLFLKSPDVFWIEYQKETDVIHPSMNLISPGKVMTKACALQNMSVNYTPLGTYMTYDDGKATMVQYDLSLTFQEITPVFQSDYKTGIAADHEIGY